MLRSLANLGNELVLKPLDLKIVRRSRVPSFGSDRAADTGAKRIAFFHVPKCGGTSVTRWLSTAFGSRAGLDPEAAEAAARNLGISRVEMREMILAYLVQRTNARFISGHYDYTRRAFQGHEDEFDFITILRNPLDRLLSDYYFNRSLEDPGRIPIQRELNDWLATDRARAMARTLLWTFVGDSEAATALNRSGEWKEMSSAVSAAIRNLEQFTIVGTLERVKEFEAEIRRRYGVKGSIGHLRQTPRPGYLKFLEQPRSVQECILELCEPDIRIYERFAPTVQAVPRLQPVPSMTG